MTIDVEKCSEIDCLVAVLSLGLCVAIETKDLTIQDAEDYLFSPYTMRVLGLNGASSEAVDLVHLGTELENVQRIVPEHLQDSLDDMRSLASAILKAPSRSSEPKSKWLQVGSAELP